MSEINHSQKPQSVFVGRRVGTSPHHGFSIVFVEGYDYNGRPYRLELFPSEASALAQSLISAMQSAYEDRGQK